MAAFDMKPSEALRKAREKLTPDGAWMQHRLISKKGNLGVRFDDPDADCFCAFGATLNVTTENGDMVDYLQAAVGTLSITVWNDDPDRTHTEVLDAFDRAVALAEAEGR